MQLKSLELFGFKSFANREKLLFDQGITGIVGPNGCGKSNIVDAVRWVLGEQKTRNLRSDKMENVIFNGTESRRKSNLAEVSLTFENTKNILPTEYTTVTITRKLYRSGESEYQINGVTCRLKDIQTLFMDTGIGSDSYAIIELKMVDEILTNKDNERRKFFEEAAGISKYKVRKKQTLKRLKDTDADLERVEDLLFEIEKNLKSLEKQASRTQRYFELKETYRLKSSQYAFLMMRNIRERQNQLQYLETNLQDQYRSLQGELAQREARGQELRKELVDAEQALSEAQADLNQHLRKIQQVETDKSIKNERLKFLQQRETAIQNQMDSERQRLQLNEQEVERISREKMTLQVELEQQEKATQSLKETLTDTEAQLNEHKSTLNEQESQFQEVLRLVQDLGREQEVKGVRIHSLEGELKRAEEDREQRSGDLDAFGEKTQELTADTQQLEELVEDLTSKKQSQEQAIAQTEGLISELKDNVYKINRKLDARQNEFNLTKSLVENLEGFPESVKFLKKNARWIKQAPLLSDVITTPETYKVAFENFLDPYLSYYVVPTRKDAILAVHMLADAAKGRANFFILEELEHYKASNPLLFTQAQAALDLVEVAPEYRKLAAFLLDKVYMVETENDVPEELPDQTVFLTRAGNLSRRKFVLSGGSLGLFEGKRLGRAKNLEKLEKVISGLQKELTAAKVELDKQIARLKQLKQKNYAGELEPVQRQLLEKQRDLSVLQSREKEHQEFLVRVGRRTEALEAELSQLKLAREEIGPKLALERENHQRLAGQLEHQRGLVQEWARQVSSLTEQYNQEHIKHIHLQNQFNNLQRELSQKQAEIERYGSTSEGLKQEIGQVRLDIDGLISSNLNDDDAIVSLYQQKKEKEDRVNRLEEGVGIKRSGIHQVESALSELRQKREKVQQQQNELRDSASDIKVELSSLRERMSVEFQVELGDLDADGLFEGAMDKYNVDKVEEEVKKIRHRIQGFGEINPMAVEAFNEMKERYDFIQGQRQDLLEAKNSLLETISEIDQTAKEKFLETYEQVRDNFQQVFRTLFSENDTCDLVLLDTENPLESEISIIARPKGKRPLTISQLSGGEKTLTAVALLFSIYLIKPAPFCVFDEVDAPLDDANIDKFNNIIRDFSQQSQFIIVTHNKRTMASTQVIYGVTMENKGVSRVLPVNLQTLSLN